MRARRVLHRPHRLHQHWGFGANATVQAQASWSNPGPVNVQYTAGNLRQGAPLDVADTLTPGAGTITVNYSVSGLFGGRGSYGWRTDIPTAVGNSRQPFDPRRIGR